MNINEAVIETKRLSQDPAFLGTFLSEEIFFEILGAPATLSEGQTIVDYSQHLRIPCMETEVGRMALFFTTRFDPRLKGKIGGVALRAAIEMVREVRELDGLILQSDSEDWIAFSKEGLSMLRLS